MKHNNGRRHPPATQQKARELRALGYTHSEIAQHLTIAKGTAHLWTTEIKLTPAQRAAMEQQRIQRFRQSRVWTKKQREEAGKRFAKLNTKYTKTRLIKQIKTFYQKNDRIPLKREFSSYHAVRSRFGSWNNAIIAAGFQPNPVYFANRVQASDGHMCDSIAEKIIDDWLAEHHVVHQCHVAYANSRMTADFYLPSKRIYIEVFGLAGAHKRYDEFRLRKLELIKQQKLNVITLSLDDVVKKKYLHTLKPLLTM